MQKTLRELRIEKNETIEDLYQSTKIFPSHLYKLEYGLETANEKIKKILCNHFGVEDYAEPTFNMDTSKNKVHKLELENFLLKEEVERLKLEKSNIEKELFAMKNDYNYLLLDTHFLLQKNNKLEARVKSLDKRRKKEAMKN